MMSNLDESTATSVALPTANSVLDTDMPQEIANYIDFMNNVSAEKTPWVTKDRIDANFENYGKAMNTFLLYPDKLVDIMTPSNSKFRLFFEQRMVLRGMVRYRQSYFTFTRGFSKSFLAFLSRYIICMVLPRHKAFIVAGTKTQAAQIAREKVIDDLWVKFPLLENEMTKFRRAGKLKDPFTDSGDSVQFNFSNGSIFDVVGGHIRGSRRNSGLFEEIIEYKDPEYINQEVIPLLNTIRLNRKTGKPNPGEPQGMKTFITTAGYQGTYAYDKLIETLCFSVLDPTKYLVMGGSYKIPVMHGLLVEDTIREILSSPSYRADEVDREYRSIWSSAVHGAAFDMTSIACLRKIKRAEYHAADLSNTNDFYVMCTDLAKDGSADTAVIIARVSIGEYRFNYRFVNLFTIDTTDYEVVANILKQVANQYNVKLLIYDANGIGASLRDWLNKRTVTQDGVPLEGLGIINPPDPDQVIQYREKERNICYEIKSGGNKASEIHRNFFAKISNGSIRLLVKTSEALSHLQDIGNFALANNTKKNLILRPYQYTDLLETEMKNLDIKDTSDAINNYVIITQRNKDIQKDFFSASEYLVYAVGQQIELPYFKEQRKKELSKKMISFVTTSEPPSNDRRSGRNIESRRRHRR